MLMAYLDPGTGSVILQALIAGFMGAMLATKLFWAKIKGFFSNLFSSKKKEDSATEE